jgi:hypothetical protein
LSRGLKKGNTYAGDFNPVERRLNYIIGKFVEKINPKAFPFLNAYLSGFIHEITKSRILVHSSLPVAGFATTVAF